MKKHDKKTCCCADCVFDRQKKNTKLISLRQFIYFKSEDGLLKEHYTSEYGSEYKTFNNYSQGYLSEMDAQEVIQAFANKNEYATISNLVIILKPIFI